MKLLRNTGNERVIDRLRDWLSPGSAIDLISPTISIYAFSELRDLLDKVGDCRLLLGEAGELQKFIFGGPADIAFRGKLQGRWLARLLADWLRKHSDM
jgi:hypothetical protein